MPASSSSVSCSSRLTCCSSEVRASAAWASGVRLFHASQIGWERRLVHLAVPAQRGGQVQRRDLGAAAQVGQDLGDRPVIVVGLRPQLVRAERLDQPGQPVVRVTQDANQGTGV